MFKKSISCLISWSVCITSCSQQVFSFKKSSTHSLIPPGIIETSQASGQLLGLTPIGELKEGGLPILMVKKVKSEDGVWIAKREEGEAIGQGEINIEEKTITLTGKKNKASIKTTAFLHQRALQNVLMRYKDYPVVKDILDTLAKGNKSSLPIQFMRHHDRMADVASVHFGAGLETVLRFNTDITELFGLAVKNNGISASGLEYRYCGKSFIVPKEQVVEGLTVLSAVQQIYGFCHMTGLDDRDAFHNVIEFYAVLSAQEKEALHAVLRSPYIDSGNVFTLFLKTVHDSQRADTDVSLSSYISLEELQSEERTMETVMRKISERNAEGASKLLVDLQARYRRLSAECGQTQRDRASNYSKKAEKLDQPIQLLSGKKTDTKKARDLIRKMYDNAQNTWKWRDKIISWMLGQSRIDLPYDRERVINVLLDAELGPDEKNQKLFDIIKDYDREVEGENIERISYEVLQRGMELFFVRMSRAGQNQGMLVADAMRTALNEGFLSALDDLKKLCADVSEDPFRNSLDELLTVSTIKKENLPSVAQIMGVLERFSRVVNEEWYIRKTEEIQDRFKRHVHAIGQERSRNGKSAIEEEINEDIKRLNFKKERINQILNDLRIYLDKSDRFDASFVVMSQGLIPRDTHLLSKINEVMSPFVGRYPDILDLVRTASQRMYASPDYRWLEHSTHWLEAIPLFIKERIVIEKGVDRTEEEIDYRNLEGFFKETIAPYWGKNLENVKELEYAALARELLVNDNEGLTRKARAMQGKDADARTYEAAVLKVILLNDLEDQVASLAVLIKETHRNLIDDVFESSNIDKVPRYAALKKIILENKTSGNLVYTAQKKQKPMQGKELSLSEAAEKVIASMRDKDVSKRLKAARISLKKIAGIKRRDPPAIEVLTTQGPGMTKMLIQTWLDESVSVQNVVNDRHLQEKVKDKKTEYHTLIQTIGRKIINEYGLWPEVMEEMTAQKGEVKDEGRAIETVIRAFEAELGKGTADLAVLIKHAEREGKIRRGSKDYTDYAERVMKTVENSMVDPYINQHRKDLEKNAFEMIYDENKSEIDEAAKKYQRQYRKQYPRRKGIPIALAREAVIKADPYYRKDLECFVRRYARRALIQEKGLQEEAKMFMRLYAELISSTAMKEVLADEKLNHLCSDRQFRPNSGRDDYQVYTPSRVDLGVMELLSIMIWGQLIGAEGKLAEQKARTLIELYHQGRIHSWPSFSVPEALKTSENAGAENNVAYSNSVALLLNAIKDGDFETFAYIMSSRGDRKVYPAGEGYGGFCVPKDGLFLYFVLNLSKKKVLRLMGVPERMHEGIFKIIKEIRYKHARGEMTDFELEAWAAEKLLNLHTDFREYFRVKTDARLIVHLDKIVHVLETTGLRDIEDGADFITNESARKAIKDIINQSERVVRFMPFYKAWMTYQALKDSVKENPDIKIDPDDFIVALLMEYKNDTQDGRFATGPRKMEIFFQTMFHLMASLDMEQQAIVYLMFLPFQYHPKKELIEMFAEDIRTRKRDREKEEITMRDARRLAEKKLRELNKKILEISMREGEDEAETVKRLEATFTGLKPPKEVRPITIKGLSEQDVINYIGDSTLKEIAERAEVKLLKAGLSPTQITANCKSHYSQLHEWAIIKDMPEKKRNDLIADIGNDMRALVLRENGLERELERAIQGIDVFDVGIPHKEVLALLEDPAKIRDLMLEFNPNSALIIVDGAAGGKKRALHQLGIQRWFAACDQVGRKGIYRSIGVGDNLIKRYRKEMEEQRERAVKLYEAMKEKNCDKADRIYADIQAQVIKDDEARIATEQEEELEWLGRVTEGDHCIRMVKHKVARGFTLDQLDFGTLLGLGFMFVADGQTEKEIDGYMKTIDEFHRAHAARAEPYKEESFSDDEISRIASAFIKCKHEPVKAEMKEEGKVEISAKAIEIYVTKQLAKRREMVAKGKRIEAMNQREKGFKKALKEIDERKRGAQSLYKNQWTPELMYDSAMKELGNGGNVISYEQFGRFLAFTREALLDMVEQVYREKETYVRKKYNKDAQEKELAQDRIAKENMIKMINQLYTGREVNADAWKGLASSYQGSSLIGALADIIDEITKDGGDKDNLIQTMAKLNELFYVTGALGKTLDHSHAQYTDIDPRVVWQDLTVFFAETIHDHFYPYTPWTNYQSKGFDEYRGHKKKTYQMAWQRHQWLYRYLRNLIITKTQLKEMNEGERDLLLGNYTNEKRITALGSGSIIPEEEPWRAYNALREVAFTYTDQVPVQDVFEEFDESIIDVRHRVNMHLMMPTGRTHLQRILIEGPRMAQELAEAGKVPCNIIISRMNYWSDIKGHKVPVVYDGHVYLTQDEYVEALVKHKKYSLKDARRIADTKIDEYIADFARNQKLTSQEVRKLMPDRNAVKGICVAVKFKNPVITPVVVPMHENPRFADGEMETNGLVATSQSRFSYWETYNKALYSDMYEGTGVILCDGFNWFLEDQKGKNKEEVLRGLRKQVDEFTKDHPVIMVKDAAESGGRQMVKFARQKDGRVINEKGQEAAEFIYWIPDTFKHDVRVEEARFCSPELFMSEEFMKQFVDRQIVEHGSAVVRNRHPGSSLFTTVRSILSTDQLPTDIKNIDSVTWHFSHPIILTSKQMITNIGRGGTLEEMREDDMLPEEKVLFMERYKEASITVMRANARYALKAAERYKKETGNDIGKDLLGASYGFPPYLMLDFVPIPVFDQEGEIEYVRHLKDENGKRIGKEITLRAKDGTRIKNAKIIDWKFYHFEPNTGIGLWDRLWLRELDHEISMSKKEERPINWHNVGKNARIVLKDWIARGEESMREIMGENYYEEDGGPKPVAEHHPRYQEVSRTLASDEELMKEAVAMTRRKLNLEPHEKIGMKELSVLMKYYFINKVISAYGRSDFSLEQGEYRVVDELRICGIDDMSMANRIKALINAFDFNMFMPVVYSIASELSVVPAQLEEFFYGEDGSDVFLTRVHETVRSYFESASIAPEKKILSEAAKPAQMRSILKGDILHAVVFEAESNFENELFPLIIDAGIHDKLVDRKDVVINVVGVRHDWINADGRAERVICYDRTLGTMVEMNLAEPVAIDSIQCHSISSGMHKEISRKARKWGVPEINPYSSSEAAAHKARMIKKLGRKMTNVLPPTKIIPRNAQKVKINALAVAFIQELLAKKTDTRIIIKPAHGTEGEGAEVFFMHSDLDVKNIRTYLEFLVGIKENYRGLQREQQFIDGILAHINRIRLERNDDIILQEVVGNIYFAENDQESKRACDLRVNVSWDGTEDGYRVSGFGQVSPDAHSAITSKSRGGTIVDLHDFFTHLYLHIREDTYQRITLTPDDIKIIQDTAINAFKAMNQDLHPDSKLYVNGSDVKLVLNIKEGSIITLTPYILDINPRPAGLAQVKPFTDEVRSTFNFWQYIKSRVSASRNQNMTGRTVVASNQKNAKVKKYGEASGKIIISYKNRGGAIITGGSVVEGERISLDELDAKRQKRLEAEGSSIKFVSIWEILHKAYKECSFQYSRRKNLLTTEQINAADDVFNQLLINIKGKRVYAIPRKFVLDEFHYQGGIGTIGNVLLQEDAFDIDGTSPLQLRKLGIALFHEQLEALSIKGNQKIMAVLESFINQIHPELAQRGPEEAESYHQLSRRGFQRVIFGEINNKIGEYFKGVIKAAVAKNAIDQLLDPHQEYDEKTLQDSFINLLSEYPLATDYRTARIIRYLKYKLSVMQKDVSTREGKRYRDIQQVLNAVIPGIVSNLVIKYLSSDVHGYTKAAFQISHQELFSLISDEAVYSSILNELHNLISSKSPLNGDPYIYWKKMRALYILRDIALMFKRNVDDGKKLNSQVSHCYSSQNDNYERNFFPAPIRAIFEHMDRGKEITSKDLDNLAETYKNQIKIEQVYNGRANYLKALGNMGISTLKPKCRLPIRKSSNAKSPMRLTSTSGNASDGTSEIMPAKANPSAVLTAVDTYDKPTQPVNVIFERTDEPGLTLVSFDRLPSKQYVKGSIDIGSNQKIFRRELRITDSNVKEFFCVVKSKEFNLANVFGDLDNPFAFMIYSLIITGVVPFLDNPEAYMEQPQRVMADLKDFLGKGGLKIVVTNTGMSGAGFASGSAVSDALIDRALPVTGLEYLKEKNPFVVPNLALLLEMGLGRGTGWQDTYGMMPGYKNLATSAVHGIPSVIVHEFDDMNYDELQRHRAVVFSGRQSYAAGALSNRVESFLSHAIDMFTTGVMESYDVHDEIVSAEHEQRWEDYGYWLDYYKKLREIICPGGATNHIMEYMFEYLMRQGVTTGGEMTGAMRGGGYCLFSLIDKGLDAQTGASMSNFELNLRKLKKWEDPLWTAINSFFPNQPGVIDANSKKIMAESLKMLRTYCNPLVTPQIIYTADLSKKGDLLELYNALLKIKEQVHPKNVSDEEFQYPLKGIRIIKTAFDLQGVHGELADVDTHIQRSVPSYLLQVLSLKRISEALLDPSVENYKDIVVHLPKSLAVELDKIMSGQSREKKIPEFINKIERCMSAKKPAYEFYLLDNGRKLAVIEKGKEKVAQRLVREYGDVFTGEDAQKVPECPLCEKAASQAQ